jgi:hypothetical protein
MMLTISAASTPSLSPVNRPLANEPKSTVLLSQLVDVPRDRSVR